MPRNRFRNALDAQAGACNPRPIAKALLDAVQDVAASPEYTARGTAAICEDPAVRLIAHQLAHLLNLRALDSGLHDYADATAVCEARADEPVPEASAPNRTLEASANVVVVHVDLLRTLIAGANEAAEQLAESADFSRRVGDEDEETEHKNASEEYSNAATAALALIPVGLR